MGHIKYCQCSIFQKRWISLPILVIHSMIMQIEEKLSDYDEFIALEWKFSGALLNQFTFHIKITIDPPSQMQKKLYLYTECTFSSLFRILKDYINHNYLIRMEMCNVEDYNELKADYFEKDLKIVEVYPTLKKSSVNYSMF